MSRMIVETKITYRYLMGKSKAELAEMVLAYADQQGQAEMRAVREFAEKMMSMKSRIVQSNIGGVGLEAHSFDTELVGLMLDRELSEIQAREERNLTTCPGEGANE